MEVGVYQADVVVFLAGNVVVEIGVVGRWLGGGGGEFDEFTVGFVLDYAVYVAVSFVIPDSLGCHVHCKGVATSGEMAVGVGFIIATATHVSADKADPEIGI